MQSVVCSPLSVSYGAVEMTNMIIPRSVIRKSTALRYLELWIFHLILTLSVPEKRGKSVHAYTRQLITRFWVSEWI